MRPMLRAGKDTILIVPLSEPLKKYDVPLYRRGESYVLHRVVEVTEKGYVICGDNCTEKEYDVTDGDIVGVLSGFRRGKKYVATDSPWYLLYARVWVACYPLRVVLVRARRAAGKLLRKIFCKK